MKYINPRYLVVMLLEHVRQANVRIVSLVVAICWGMYVDAPGRQVTAIDEAIISDWMTLLAIVTSPTVVLRTPLLWRRVTHFVISANWLCWSMLLTAMEDYNFLTQLGQWMLAVFSLAAMLQILVTDEEEERRGA